MCTLAISPCEMSINTPQKIRLFPKVWKVFGYFVLIWWQTDRKEEILKESCKDLFVWTELINV